MQLQAFLLLLILVRVPALPSSGWKGEEDGAHTPLRTHGQVVPPEARRSPAFIFGVFDEEAIATRANHLIPSGIQKKDLSITLNRELQYMKEYDKVTASVSDEQRLGNVLKKIITKSFGINTKGEVTNEKNVLKKSENNINHVKVVSRTPEERNRIKRGISNVNLKLKNTKPLSILSLLVEEEESKREDDEYYNDTPELLQMLPLLQLKSSIKKEDPDDYYQE